MRVGHVATPAAVWAHPTRTLTNPPAAQNLSNMRVGLASGYYPTVTEIQDGLVAAGASFTPAVSGIFMAAADTTYLYVEVYSDSKAAWITTVSARIHKAVVGMANLIRFTNGDTVDRYVVVQKYGP